MRKQVGHKFNAMPTVIDGSRFDSKREAKYYQELKLRKSSGDIVFFLRQVPVHLLGGTVLRVDFLEFHADGTVHFIDVKGVETKEFKIKKREVEAIYPIEIEIVK